MAAAMRRQHPNTVHLGQRCPEPVPEVARVDWLALDKACAMVIPAIDAVVTVIEGGTVTEKTQYYPLDLITKENAEQFKDQLY